MLRIGQLKLQPNHTEDDFLNKIAHSLRISKEEVLDYKIKKQSLDARKKPDLTMVYTVDVMVKNEQHVQKKCKNKFVTVAHDKPYTFPTLGTTRMEQRPIIIGSGPSGLFCAYMLAQHGFRPIVFERGASVEERAKDIETFWKTGVLNTQSNVQFGEGGAGTFSDGKLNTMVKDAFGRNKKVLEIFVENGAPNDILYINKPHIGTDILLNVVRNMRNRIIAWGGEIHFHSQFIDFSMDKNKVSSIVINKDGENIIYNTQILILAIGHSARDTFTMLYKRKLPISQKSFAVGVRVEHPQTLIDQSQYGKEHEYELPAASYKVTTQLEDGRGVYSFCMCPGGYVVNASSEEGYLAVNGMSYHARDGKNANSAIIVTISPQDFGTNHPLGGMFFQRELEQNAYKLGMGKIPVQRFEDFCNHVPSKAYGKVEPQHKGESVLSNVRSIFSKDIGNSIELGIKSFDKQIQGFANPDTLLSGVESRTSSPIRIERNKEYEIGETGIYPCGEGAGYAGGITSAAMDGIKVSEIIASKYQPFDVF